MPDRIEKRGEHFGNYAVVRPIGSGGMGVVYEAEHRALGRRAALKVLNRPASIDPADVERSTARFLREGRAAAQVRHPHVVDVYDFGVEDGRPYLVMELVEGETLAAHLRRERRLSVAQVVEIFLPVLSAVAELHAMGIIHRDLKPANVLITRDRSGALCPKLGDFGVSRVESDVGLTQSGAVLGTPLYMSPELTRSAKAATERADQYALGVMLYEATTGLRPFRGATSYELMHAIVTADARPPRAIVPSLPERFEAIILRAMAAAAEDRFDSVDELAQALLAFASPAVAERWRAEFTEGTEPAAVVEIRSAPRALPRRVWPAALIVAAVALAAVGARHAMRAAPPNTATMAPALAPMPVVPPLSAPVAPAPVVAPEPAPIVNEASVAPPSSASPPLRPSRPAPRPPAHPAVTAAHPRGENGAPILEVE